MSARFGEALSTSARHAVIDWNLRLIDGLPWEAGRDRMAQIESDLWEHAAAHRRRGGSELGLAIAVLGRLGRGVPADRVWRADVARTARERAQDLLPVGVPAGRAKRHAKPAAKPWVHLQEGRPFDQTNGAVDFEGEAPVVSDADERLAMLERGAAMNLVNVGFGGGF